MWARIQCRCLPLVAHLGRAVQKHPASREIALAAALGALLGLLPKTNFFSLVFLLLLLRLKANVAAGLVSALVFTGFGIWCEPFLHRTGFLVLTWQPVVPVWTWIYNLPLAAWTGFNQTLVMGGLCAGAYLFWPVMVLTSWLVERYRSPLSQWLARQPWSIDLQNSLRDLGGTSP